MVANSFSMGVGVGGGIKWSNPNFKKEKESWGRIKTAQNILGKLVSKTLGDM